MVMSMRGFVSENLITKRLAAASINAKPFHADRCDNLVAVVAKVAGRNRRGMNDGNA